MKKFLMIASFSLCFFVLGSEQLKVSAFGGGGIILTPKSGVSTYISDAVSTGAGTTGWNSGNISDTLLYYWNCGGRSFLWWYDWLVSWFKKL